MQETNTNLSRRMLGKYDFLAREYIPLGSRVSEVPKGGLSHSQVMARSNSYLYCKYAQSQTYYHTRDLNDALAGNRCAAAFLITDLLSENEQEEFLNRGYQLHEYNDKLDLLVEYYKFHNDVPRLFMVPTAEIIHNFYDKKRRLNYIKVTQMLKGEVDWENIRREESDSEDGYQSRPDPLNESCSIKALCELQQIIPESLVQSVRLLRPEYRSRKSRKTSDINTPYNKSQTSLDTLQEINAKLKEIFDPKDPRNRGESRGYDSIEISQASFQIIEGQKPQNKNFWEVKNFFDNNKTSNSISKTERKVVKDNKKHKNKDIPHNNNQNQRNISDPKKRKKQKKKAAPQISEESRNKHIKNPPHLQNSTNTTTNNPTTPGLLLKKVSALTQQINMTRQKQPTLTTSNLHSRKQKARKATSKGKKEASTSGGRSLMERGTRSKKKKRVSNLNINNINININFGHTHQGQTSNTRNYTSSFKDIIEPKSSSVESLKISKLNSEKTMTRKMDIIKLIRNTGRRQSRSPPAVGQSSKKSLASGRGQMGGGGGGGSLKGIKTSKSYKDGTSRVRMGNFLNKKGSADKIFELAQFGWTPEKAPSTRKRGRLLSGKKMSIDGSTQIAEQTANSLNLRLLQRHRSSKKMIDFYKSLEKHPLSSLTKKRITNATTATTTTHTASNRKANFFEKRKKSMGSLKNNLPLRGGGDSGGIGGSNLLHWTMVGKKSGSMLKPKKSKGRLNKQSKKLANSKSSRGNTLRKNSGTGQAQENPSENYPLSQERKIFLSQDFDFQEQSSLKQSISNSNQITTVNSPTTKLDFFNRKKHSLRNQGSFKASFDRRKSKSKQQQQQQPLSSSTLRRRGGEVTSRRSKKKKSGKQKQYLQVQDSKLTTFRNNISSLYEYMKPDRQLLVKSIKASTLPTHKTTPTVTTVTKKGGKSKKKKKKGGAADNLRNLYTFQSSKRSKPQLSKTTSGKHLRVKSDMRSDYSTSGFSQTRRGVPCPSRPINTAKLSLLKSTHSPVRAAFDQQLLPVPNLEKNK